jgi:hypothetical protein
MIPTYKIARDLGIVTVYPAIVVREGFDPEAFGVDLDENDLLAMLVDLHREPVSA